jgi:hypothetical protein
MDCCCCCEFCCCRRREVVAAAAELVVLLLPRSSRAANSLSIRSALLPPFVVAGWVLLEEGMGCPLRLRRPRFGADGSREDRGMDEEAQEAAVLLVGFEEDGRFIIISSCAVESSSFLMLEKLPPLSVEAYPP